jgi:hypothetical protein
MTSTNADLAKIQSRVYPTLLKGLTVLCKEKPEDPIRYLANWLIENNPYKPRAVDPPDADALLQFDSQVQIPQ